MTDDSETLSRVTFGLTPAGLTALEALMEKRWFPTEATAFKAAVAFAIANDVPATVGGKYNTKWNVGTLDRSGDFGPTIGLLLGTSNPWAEVSALADAGLRVLAERATSADVPTEALLTG